MVYRLEQYHNLNTIWPIMSTVIHHSTNREGGGQRQTPKREFVFPREIPKQQQVQPVVIFRGAQGGEAPKIFALTLLFKVSPLSIKISRSLVFKDRDVNCISLVLSFIPSILPFYEVNYRFCIFDIRAWFELSHAHSMTYLEPPC